MFLLPVAALMAASCSNEEKLESRNAQQQAVSFRPLVDRTRGEAVTLSNLQQFRIFAKGTEALESEFTDIVTDGGDGTWSTQNVHYWNSTAGNETKEAQFTAVYPASLMTAFAATTPLDFSSLANGRDQVDVMAAFNTATKATDADNGVALKFKHALSQIVVRASNKNTDQRKVEIVGVKIANVKTKHTLYLPVAPTNGTAAYTPFSGEPTTPIDMIIKGKAADAVTLTSTAQDIMFDGGGFMVIPQTFTTADAGNLQSSDTYISVLCRIYVKNETTGAWQLVYPYVAEGTTDNGSFAFTSVGISGAWEPGKKYTYTLNFYQGTGGSGTVDPDYTDPTDDPDPDPGNPNDPSEPKQPTPDPENPTPTDPTNPDPTNPDPNPTKVPIFFTVTVDDWTDATDGDFNKVMD